MISTNINNEKEIVSYFQGLLVKTSPDPYSDIDEIFKNAEDAEFTTYEISENNKEVEGSKDEISIQEAGSYF